MQTEARVGVVVEGGGHRALSSGHAGGAGALDGGARRYSSHHPQQQQQLQHQPQIGTVAHLISGGVAGAVSKTCTAPLARLTILFQVQGMHSDVATLRKASIWHEASRVVHEEGFRAFWRGNLVTIAHRLPYSSISFYTYERYKNFLQLVPGLDKRRDSVSADVCVRLFGGGLAGITAASMTYPLDLVRTRLAAQYHAAVLLPLYLDKKRLSKLSCPLSVYKNFQLPSNLMYISSPSVCKLKLVSIFIPFKIAQLVSQKHVSQGSGSLCGYHLLKSLDLGLID